jgi:hypothetical protein
VSIERMKTKMKVLTGCNIEPEVWLDYVEGEVSHSLGADLSLHLSQCDKCQKNYADIKMLKKELKKNDIKVPSDDYFKGLENKIMASLDKNVGAEGGQLVAVAGRVAVWTRRMTIPLAASAALFLLIFGGLYKTMKFNTEANPEVAQTKLEEQFIVQTATNNPEIMSNSMISHQGQDDLVITAAAEKLSKMSRKDAAKFMRGLR